MSAPSIEHSSSTPVHRESELLVEQPSLMPGNKSESPIEHSSLTPTESAGFDLDELTSVLIDQQPNPKTADKATQAPEKQPYVCFACGHEVREPIIANICCRIIRWIGSGLLWCTTTTPIRSDNAALDLEPDSDD